MIRRRMVRGIATGLAVAAVYSVYVTVLWLVQGGEPFAKHGTTLLGVILAYQAAGIAGGLVFGAAQPFVRNWLSAAAVGVAVALPVMWCIEITSTPRVEWFTTALSDSLVLGSMLGAVCGIMVWRATRTP